MPQLIDLHFRANHGIWQNCTSDESECTIAIWHTTESESDLLNDWCTHSDVAQDFDYTAFRQQYQSESRRVEWLATRCLLARSLGRSYRIAYTTSGQPFLTCHIVEASPNPLPSLSISHTKDYVAIAFFRGKAVGLDLEKQSLRAYGIVSRFLQTQEQQELLQTPESATALWCAKEAVYKLANIPTLRFLDQICLTRDCVPLQLRASITAGSPMQALVILHFLPQYALTLALALPQQW